MTRLVFKRDGRTVGRVACTATYGDAAAFIFSVGDWEFVGKYPRFDAPCVYHAESRSYRRPRVSMAFASDGRVGVAEVSSRDGEAVQTVLDYFLRATGAREIEAQRAVVHPLEYFRQRGA